MKNWVNSHPSRAEAVPTGSPGPVTGIERKVAMLRNLGIRSKILAVLALPVVVLLLAATIIAGGAVADARRAVEVEKLASQAPGLTQLIRGLQAERALSTAQLSGAPAPQLEEVRKQVSGGLQAVRGGIAPCVVLHALYERTCAVAYAYQCNPDCCHRHPTHH